MITHNILYFGCIGEAGHYLHDKTNSRIRYNATPWGDHLDGGIQAKSRHSHEPGYVHSDKKGGWTAVTWADYSVDTRGGSISVFLVAADITVDELITLARAQWPEVFGRRRFPALRFA